MKFYIVDVFATERFSGNQVAIVERNKNISAKEMQKIAQEMNFTETIFFSPEKDKRGRYNARIFTPEKEVEFSGHAIVGCAYVLINYYAKRHNLKYVHFQLIHESVKIEIEHGKEDDIGGDVFWIEEQEP